MTKFEWVLMAIVVLILVVAGEIMLRDSSFYIKYDCRIAEISPDYPIEVKNLCRKIKK